MNKQKKITLYILLVICLSSFTCIQSAFHTNLGSTCYSSRSANKIQGLPLHHHGKNSRFLGRTMTFRPTAAAAGAHATRGGNRKKATELAMFLGSDGGILGVGAPEVATILLVGYFVLGPTELFKLTKEIGKFIQNIRTLGTEATKSFESTMENQLELQELRKAQSELSNAFSFRRSINVDQDSEAFSEIPPISMTKEGGVAATAGGVTGTVATTTSTGTASSSTEDVVPRKKKKKRRVKKKVSSPVQESVEMGDIPDLDMSAAFQDEFMQGMGGSSSSSSRKDEGGNASFETLSSRGEETNMEDAATKLRKERMERLEAAQSSSRSLEASPYSKSDWNGASESDVASEILSKQLQPNTADETSLVVDTAAQSRFEAQLNGQWNQQIMANEEKLSPLAQVMGRLAILEEERLAANIRLDEEFARRAEIEEKFYREKRMVLEEAAAQISAEAYSNFNFDEKSSDIISSTTTQSTTVSETTKETQQVSNSSFFNGANFNENQ